MIVIYFNVIYHTYRIRIIILITLFYKFTYFLTQKICLVHRNVSMYHSTIVLLRPLDACDLNNFKTINYINFIYR